jgi:hypothetical protein
VNDVTRDCTSRAGPRFRMLAEDGQRDQAQHTLFVVWDRFSEGFEIADLKLARALLETLR